MAKAPDDLDLAPRVSILEKGQEAIQRDLLNLTHSVKEQGTQLTTAILSLSQSQNSNYNALSEKIGSNSKTDWPTLMSLLGLVFIVIGALMTHIYIQFSYVDREILKINNQIEQVEISLKQNLTTHAILNTRIEHLEKQK